MSDAPAITLPRRRCCRRDSCCSQVSCIRRSRIHFLPCQHRLMRLPRTRGARRAASVIVPVCGQKLSSNCCVARDILAPKLTQKTLDFDAVSNERYRLKCSLESSRITSLFAVVGSHQFTSRGAGKHDHFWRCRLIRPFEKHSGQIIQNSESPSLPTLTILILMLGVTI